MRNNCRCSSIGIVGVCGADSHDLPEWYLREFDLMIISAAHRFDLVRGTFQIRDLSKTEAMSFLPKAEQSHIAGTSPLRNVS